MTIYCLIVTCLLGTCYSCLSQCDVTIIDLRVVMLMLNYSHTLINAHQ